MAFIVNPQGGRIDIPVDGTIYKAAGDANMSVPQFLNKKYSKDADPKLGNVFQQMCASEGLLMLPNGKDNPMGVTAPTIASIFDGTSGFSAATTNVQQSGTPYGTASRTLFPAALIAYIEAQVDVDRVTDTVMFNDMVAQTLAVNGDHFEQPIINYNNQNGSQQAKHQRVAQLAPVPTMLSLTTSDRMRRLPTYGMGIEMSDQAMRVSTIDTLAFTVARYLQVEHDQRVYNFLSSLFAGDNDMVIGAVSAVTSNSLDSAATGGVLTHKAWVKFLARNRKRRRISHIIGDIDTYLKIEGRAGRPGLSAYDPRLSVIDPQGKASNVSFGSDVKYFIVDAAVDGGPVPANTIWALDAKQAIVKVSNLQAEYTAVEQFVSRRSQMLTMQWSAECFRMYGDAELTPFDVLTIS